MRRLTTPALAVLVMALSACAGPKADLQVGTQTAPINLVLGAREAVVQAPIGPISGPLPPGLAPFVPQGPTGPVTAVPSARPEVPKPQLPCPMFDALDPVLATGIVLPGPPQPATYTYRGKVVDTVGTSKATYTGDSSWKVTVSEPDASTGGYLVTTEVSLGKSTSKRVLLVLPTSLTSENPDAPVPGVNGDLDDPNSTDPNSILAAQVNSTLVLLGLPTLPRVLPNPGRYGPAGIYLVSQTHGASTFTPTVPMPILQTPVGNNSFTAMGTDGSTVMTFTSTVKKRANVNACGTKLEGIEVSLTDGRIAGRGSDGKVQEVSFGETLVFGLQFGGLPISDVGTLSSSVAPGAAGVPDTASRDFSFTINSTPKPAKV